MGNANGGWLQRLSAGIMGWANRTNEASRGLARNPDRTATAAAFRWPEHEECVDVVGEQSYQPNLVRLVGDHGNRSANVEVAALLYPEDGNPHDDKAVSVWIEGYLVGHLSRDEARSFRRRLSSKKLSNQPTACSALVMGGFIRDSGERASYGVQLLIKPFM